MSLERNQRGQAIVDELYRHGLRVAALASTLCRQVGLQPAYIDTIRQAATLHDIGKLTMLPALWSMSHGLTAEQRMMVQDHTRRGHALIGRLAPTLDPVVADTALRHHEAWDGSGYPDSQRAEAIPFAARLVGLCDVYAALREERAYKAGLSHEHALQIMLARDPAERVHQGMFDPRLFALFIRSGQRLRTAFDRANADMAVDEQPGLPEIFREAVSPAAGGWR
jgi:putative two-component system response regulator